MPYRTLLPAFAQDNLHLDASGLGLLMSATGFGALISSLILCSMGDPSRKGRLLIGSGLVLGLSLAAYVALPYMSTALVFIALVGATNNVCMVMNNTLLQGHCEEAYRGRVMSVYMMLWGLTPLGTLPSGALADRVGVPWVVVGMGALTLAIFAIVGRLRPEIRTLE
jgi:MFS family permease